MRMLSGITALVIPVQFMKAPEPMEVTELGIATSPVSPVQPRNADSPIAVTV